MTYNAKKLDDGTPAPGGAAATVPLPVEAQGRIGRQLQQIYGQMLSEPMPDKFTQLLADLAKSEGDKQ